MRVGELARRAGVTVRALRYDEKAGLARKDADLVAAAADAAGGDVLRLVRRSPEGNLS